MVQLFFSSGEAAYCWVCTRQEFLRNMTRTQDYKVSAHQESVIGTHTFIMMIYNNNLLHLYSAFLGTQSALHSKGLSPHPPPMCSIHLDDVTAAILGQNAHHTPAYWWRGDRVMEPISVWGWLGGHDGQRPMGEFGQDAEVTPLLFSKYILGFLMTTKSQDLGLTSHAKDGAFYSLVSPSLHWGVRTHTDHRVSTPCWPH